MDKNWQNDPKLKDMDRFRILQSRETEKVLPICCLFL